MFGVWCFISFDFIIVFSCCYCYCCCRWILLLLLLFFIVGFFIFIFLTVYSSSEPCISFASFGFSSYSSIALSEANGSVVKIRRTSATRKLIVRAKRTSRRTKKIPNRSPFFRARQRDILFAHTSFDNQFVCEMAVFLINICKFNGCGIKFDSLGELITHIENIHIGKYLYWIEPV